MLYKTMLRKVIKHYRVLPLPLRATMWFSICQFIIKGINLLTMPFITRMLSTEEYGIASTFLSWESLFMIVVTLSSLHAVMNLCVKCMNRERMFSSLMGYNLVVSAIWGILLLLTVKYISKITGLSYLLISCLYLYCTFMSITNCWIQFEQFEYSYKKVVAETLIYATVTSFGALFAITFISKTAEAKIIPQVISSVIIGLFVIISGFKSGKSFYDKEVWSFTFFFCVPLLPHYLSEIVLMSSDRIMIDKMCGSSDVAIYSLAYSVGSLINMVTSAVNSAFAPYQYHKIKDREYKVLAKNTNYIIGIIALCLCGIMLFGREVVLFFGGVKYLKSVSLIIPISLGVFFNYLFQLFARVQEYFEQKYTIVIASISCALLNIILNYVFINLYGFKAAAYTTFFCYFVFCFFHYVFYRMACRKHIGQEIYDIKGLAMISACLIVATMLINLISRLYILKYILVAVALVLMISQRKRMMRFINKMREES